MPSGASPSHIWNAFPCGRGGATIRFAPDCPYQAARGLRTKRNPAITTANTANVVLYNANAGSGVWEKNLDRLTVIAAVVFMATIVIFMLTYPLGTVASLG